MTTQERFPHRHNSNGSFDAICRECLVTVATVFVEADLAGFEARHSCDPVRLYRLYQGWGSGYATTPYRMSNGLQKANGAEQ